MLVGIKPAPELVLGEEPPSPRRAAELKRASLVPTASPEADLRVPKRLSLLDDLTPRHAVVEMLTQQLPQEQGRP